MVSRLEKRKQDVVTTLAYIGEQQNEVDRNTQWKDLSTQRRRYAFLAGLLSRYERELKRIDKILDRKSGNLAGKA